LKISQKIYLLVDNIFNIAILIMVGLHFLNIKNIGNVGIDILILFIGLKEIFSGLNKIEVTQQKDLEEFNKLIKQGVLHVICGLTIVIAVIIIIFNL
jgi:hypothetical protein